MAHSDLILRPAHAEDAPGIAAVLSALKAAGKRRKAGDADFARVHYIAHPHRIALTLALEAGQVLGFQSLKLATPGNPYGTPVGWGIIGTHIHPAGARRGIGKALAAVTIKAARDAGLRRIEARTGTENLAALAFYGAIGFSQLDGVEPGVLIHELT